MVIFLYIVKRIQRRIINQIIQNPIFNIRIIFQSRSYTRRGLPGRFWQRKIDRAGRAEYNIIDLRTLYSPKIGPQLEGGIKEKLFL